MRYSITRRSPFRARWYNVLLVVAAVLLSLGVVAGLGAYSWYKQQLEPLTSQSIPIDVNIASGATGSDIAAQLEDKQVIRSAFAFEKYLAFNGYINDLQAGRYQLDSSYSVPEIADILTKGKVQRGLFTILPGQRLDQIRQRMLDSGFDAATVDAALQPSAYANHPALIGKPASASLEGYLFPDSYERTAATTPSEIIRQALDETADALTSQRNDQFSAQKLNTFQAITLASIIVKESSNPIEQKNIAGVFYNRLRAGIPLGADPTYQYASALAGLPNDGKIDSPYNTRLYAGLPPGPIGTITLPSLEAVAQPTNSEYLFFVAGDDGKIYYSKTQAEHEALTRQHCVKLCSQY